MNSPYVDSIRRAGRRRAREAIAVAVVGFALGLLGLYGLAYAAGAFL